MKEGFSLNWGGVFPISSSDNPFFCLILLIIKFLVFSANRSEA